MTTRTLTKHAAQGLTRRAALYCRISLDREGAGLGVARQEEDGRALARRLGWAVTEVYVDNDTSAYSGKPRPAWNRLIAGVRAGALDAVVCWHVDRLTRSPRELEDVIDLADRHGLALATCTGDIDLSTPTGRMVARMLGAAARHESEHKGERQRRQVRQAAEAGKVAGGGHRPFGYAADRVTMIESEAVVIRECAARLLGGESLNSVCRDLNARRIITTTGKAWQTISLRSMLASARISGRREIKPLGSYTGGRPLLGEITADVAAWPAIIAPADSDRLRTLLSNPARRTSPGTGRKYLLSGILHCGHPECGRPMVARPRSDASKGAARYLCRNDPGAVGCGRMMIHQEHTDDHIRDLLLDTLNSPEFVQRLRHRDQAPDDLHARIRDDEDELEALAADRGSGEISRAEWKAARAPIVARLDAARERLATSTQTNALDGFVGSYDEMLVRWEAANLSQRRAVVTAVLEKVIVHPAAVRGQFDPNRLEPIWRA
ncbi:MAG: recombinase family protein [Pseudonocardiaceae bacterium]